MSESPWVEWSILQDLNWLLKERLSTLRRRSSLGYPRLRRSAFENKRDLLEVELRNTLIQSDIDFELLQQHEGFQSLKSHLKSLIRLLDALVNMEFMETEMQQQESSNPYPMIQDLIQRLKTINQSFDLEQRSFDLVRRTTEHPPLFQVQNLSAARLALETTTDFNSSLYQVLYHQNSIDRKRRRSPTQEVDDATSFSRNELVDFRYRKHIFDALFSRLLCGNPHEIMLQLNEHGQLALDMFLSTCQSKEAWQEVQCSPYKSTETSTQIENLCETLINLADQRIHLMVETVGEDSYSIYCSARSSGRSHIHPSSSLEQLIQRGLFKNIGLSNISGIRLDRFNLHQKRTLAFKLSQCLLDFFDSKFIGNSLESANIFFFHNPKKGLQDSLLYIRCSQEPPGLPRTNDRFVPGHPVMTSFAKLLLEIDEGETFHDSSGNESQYNIPPPSWAPLCHLVAIRELDRGQSHYLDAIKGCLYFHQYMIEAMSSLPCQEEEEEDLDTTIKEVIHEKIIKPLKQEVYVRAFGKRRRVDALDSDKMRAIQQFNSASEQHHVHRHSHYHNRSINGAFSYGEMSQVHLDALADDMGYPQQRTLFPHRPREPSPLTYSSSSMSNASQSSILQNSFGMEPRTRDDFKVAIICALPREADAVEALFDKSYDTMCRKYGKQSGDDNMYTNGRIGQHNIVLCYMPEMGKSSAASVSSSLRTSYRKIELALVVGVCGGVPFPPNHNSEVILGDVIISDSVVDYNFGKQNPDGFERKKNVSESLGRPNRRIRSLLTGMKSRNTRIEFQNSISQHLTQLQAREAGVWDYPGVEHDLLFEAGYRHKHHHPLETAPCICADCKSDEDPICAEASSAHCEELMCTEKVIQRKRLKSIPKPAIHIGTMASTDTVMKSGRHRDKVAKREGIIGFEMEGAGVWDNIPCIVIKGVCDYADSHKNKSWQDYAAATAAAGAKTFLTYWDSGHN